MIINDDKGCQSTLTATLQASPTHAVNFSFNSDGSFNYTAPDNWAGVDKFAYSLNGYNDVEMWAIVEIYVVNYAPQGEEDYYVTVKNTILRIPAARGLLENDTDYDDSREKVQALEFASPRTGSVQINKDGSFSYTPGADFTGTDVFYYVLYDGIDFSEPIAVHISVVQVDVDIDTDSDNNGPVERSDFEDSIEVDEPGNLLRGDSGLYVGSTGTETPTELEEVYLSVGFTYADLTGFHVSLVGNDPAGSLKVWADTARTPLPQRVWTIGVDNLPNVVYVEGVTAGVDDLYLILTNPDHVTISFDKVKFTTVIGDLRAYRQRTDHFPEYQIPFSKEGDIGIRRNGDDDNQNGMPDYYDPAETVGENDTMKVYPVTLSGGSGVEWTISRSNSLLGVWGSSTRTDPILRPHTVLSPNGLNYSDEAVLQGGATIWVEWTDGLSDETAVSLTLTARAKNTHNGIGLDTIVYSPFNNITVVWLGEFQEPTPNAIWDGVRVGLMEWSIDQYEEGYDIYAFEERDALLANAVYPAHDEIKNAINYRGVSSVALIGYSHGGGTVWMEADLLTNGVNGIFRPFVITFTGFIDAISQNTWLFGGTPGTPFAVNTRPPGSLYHVGQYQRTLPLMGARSGGDDDIDRTYLGVNHGSIDDNRVVLDFLELRYRQKVKK